MCVYTYIYVYINTYIHIHMDIYTCSMGCRSARPTRVTAPSLTVRNFSTHEAAYVWTTHSCEVRRVLRMGKRTP